MGSTLKNRYRIVKQLGSGGFGETFLAEDLDVPSRRQCVVKKLKSAAPDVAPQMQAWFEREAQTLEALGEDSQGRVLKLYAYFIDAKDFFLVQEYIPGDTLAERIAKRGPLSDAEARRLLQELLVTLEYVHGKRVIHRDIKPQNIILRASDELPVLIDYGVVKHAMTTKMGATHIAQQSLIAGTPGYMAPEQWRGRTVFASDLYALARTVVFAVTGQPPQNLNDLVTGEFSWRPHAPQTGMALATILEKGLDEDFKRRHPTAHEMRADLDHTNREAERTTVIHAPNDAESLFNRGNAYANKGDYDRAITDFDKAIRLKPDDADAFINRGLAYERKGDYDRAFTDYDQAIRLKPDDADAFINRGVAYERKGDTARAQLSITKRRCRLIRITSLRAKTWNVWAERRERRAALPTFRLA